jgi:glycosyltransferase involved in cell wall biosynthesis
MRYLHLQLGLNDPRVPWLESQRLSGVKAVINYAANEGSSGFLWRLRTLCKKHRVSLLNLVVEWHALSQAWPSVPAVLDGEFQRRVLNRLVDGTICISTHLEEYYRGRAKTTVVIPPLLDLTDPKWQAPSKSMDRRPLTLVFSGSHNRERHDIMLKAVRQMRDHGTEIRMEYLGSTRDQISSMPGVGADLIRSLGDSVLFHGRVAEEHVHDIAAAASFAIILRNNARWSRCCFPSKVPEFCALGVPMLCNLTSDLNQYLVDGQNAIVVEDITVDSLCKALSRALALSHEQRENMRAAARRTAKQFDGLQFADVYRRLINEALPRLRSAGVRNPKSSGFDHAG